MTRRPVREQATCHVCGLSFPVAELRPWIAVRPGVSALIEAEASGWQEGARICQSDLARFRRQYVEQMLEDERGELGALDRAVLDSLESGQTLSRHLETAFDDRITFGERMADRVASFGGSWPFILIFLCVLILWIGTNVAGLLRAPFDPYPFILLNLVLSCIAALQAPIIMMSQRRQETKDRLRGENDYSVNLKAELEIRQLHEKIDHQLAHQWQRLVEMQQIQIEMLEDRNRDRR
ncbi:MAG: hypothetical protein CVT86_01765 [Alphaproteobacteria bacterium HGW-Alphaproteobacteria-8]|nr:MAG: hypothetical protein CVT86_01765 [Alphaproteobacteria bacterium HGW-Alphaproteobacteria-8]